MSVAALHRAQLLSRGSTSEERRQYVEQLLTLPAYKDPQLTTYFAETISIHFAEFEDLQDQAVDAVLDLCEDEADKTRISGIKALARIGKVEPRWVKGNTGVLLQLLESPPTEVVHVRQALYDLLDVSAVDVLGMMIEDCKGAEDESGASRHNVLDFLQTAKEKRAEILESGKNLEAEKVFAEGFYEVIRTTAIAETRRVLSLLLPLSTISGKNATPQNSGKFAKALTRCLHAGSSVGLTTPLLRLWAELDKRNPRLDPRWTLYFLADHGAAVISLMAEKDDNMAKETLLTPTRDVRRLRQALEQRTDGDLNERKLLPAFAQTMLKAALRLTEKPSALEIALYPVYMAVTANRSTRDAIRDSSLRRDLDSLGRTAQKRKRDAGDSKDEDLWRNIRDMAETMADRDLKPLDIRPTWTSRDRQAAVPAKPDHPQAPQRDPVSDDRKESLRATANNGVTMTTPSVTDQVAATTNASVAQASSSKPAARSNPPPPTKEDPVPQPSSASVADTNTKPTPTTTTNGLSILARAKQQETSTVSLPSTPPQVPTELSIRSRANQPPQSPSPATTVPAPEAQAGPSGSTVHPTAQGLSIRSSATNKKATEPAPRSLLSRLSSGDVKRPRELDTEPSSNEAATAPKRGDLASRLGMNSEAAKRPRIDSLSGRDPAHKSSLLERLGSPGQVLPSPLPTPAPTPLAGFSIKNRASSDSSPKANPPVHPPALSAPSTDTAETEIVRKGRGFASRQSAQINNILAQPFRAGGRGHSGRELL